MISGSISTVNAVGQISIVTINNGSDTTVSVPSGTTSILIQPPNTNTVAFALKYAAGDAGVPLHKTAPTLLSLDTTATAIILRANSALPGPIEMVFV